MHTPRIRPYHPHDFDAVYRICLETGDSGLDATRLYRDARIIGHVYAGPYVTHQRDLAFVLEDDRGVSGYILGALDTRAFEDLLEREWWPKLRDQYLYPATPPENRTRDEQLQAMIHRPPRADADVLAEYPSHLHIDLLPRAQGGGNGRRLMMTLLGALRERGSRGVHLGVGTRNERAVGFYRHIGFRTLKEHPGSLVMGFPLTP